MKSLTLRDISEDLMERVRAIAKRERRSLNQSLLILIEAGLRTSIARNLAESDDISDDAQLALWEQVCGTWEDDRSTRAIISDIYKGRTKGREVKL